VAIEEPGNFPDWLRVCLDSLSSSEAAESKLPTSGKETGKWGTA
jgi:hypothetical protein